MTEESQRSALKTSPFRKERRQNETRSNTIVPVSYQISAFGNAEKLKQQETLPLKCNRTNEKDRF
jgi:hypothetical protein